MGMGHWDNDTYNQCFKSHFGINANTGNLEKMGPKMASEKPASRPEIIQQLKKMAWEPLPAFQREREREGGASVLPTPLAKSIFWPTMRAEGL